MLKEYAYYIVFGAYKALWIGIDHWIVGGLNFKFWLGFVLLFTLIMICGLPNTGTYGKVEDICKSIILE
jgi:hypothetical protein